MSEPAIKKALRYETAFSQDKTLLRKYEIQEKATRDYIQGMYSAEKRGEAKGKAEEKINNVLGLLAIGVEIEKIAEGLKLDIETVKELKKKHNL